MRDDWQRVIRLARSQHGAVSRVQAAALGIEVSAFDARIRREGWDIPFPGVGLAPWATDRAKALTSAAGWAVAPAGGLTADSALAFHGARVALPDPPVVVVPHGRHGTLTRELTVIRSRTLRPSDLSRVDGGAATTVPRAVMDLAVRSSLQQLRERLIDLRQRRLLDLDELGQRIAAAKGMTGLPKLRQAMADVSGTGADSVFTAMVERALQDAGIHPDPHPAVVQTSRRTLHPDITFVDSRVAIECDSLGFHADQTALDKDTRKHNAYRLSGWLVLRIGWLRYHRDIAGFLTEVRRALRSRSGLTR